MDYILELIEEEATNILHSNHKNIVLVLGNYGVGKRIFTQFIAGNNTNLISKEIGIDTGDYIIEDNDQINDNTTNLKETLLPQLVIDTKTDTAYYNCPGFSDPRNPFFEIASTYFIRKLIDNAEKVKLVFIVNHHSIKIDGDRKNFMTLVKHATGLIKDIDKFADSISLIATKVENNYVMIDNKIELVSDIKLIKNIVNFLENTKVSINSQLNEANSENKIFYKNALKFIDILMQKQDDNYPRVGLFRQPEEPGILSEIVAMQEAKQKLTNIIQNNTEFVEKNENDFGYTISAASKNAIYDLVEEINKNFTENTKRLSQNVFEFYTSNENFFNDIKLLRDHFQSSHISMQTVLDNMKSPNDIVIAFEKFGYNYSIRLSKYDFNSIVKYDKYLNILEMISPDKLIINFAQWKMQFEEMVNKLVDNKNWYNFLLSFKAKLSEYNVQKNIKIFDIKGLKLKIFQENQQKNAIFGSTLQEFLNQIYFEDLAKGYPILNYDKIKDIEIDQVKLEVFYEIIRFGLESKPNFICNERNQLIIRGIHIQLSDVLNNNKCSEKLKAITIYALNKVFIDVDLIRRGENLQILIIAPEWDIIDNKRTIDLTGTSTGKFLGIGNSISKKLSVIGSNYNTNSDITTITLNRVDKDIQKAIDFTAYIRENMSFGRGYENMFKLHEQLTYKFILLNNTDIFGYIGVFISFENQFFKLKKSVDFKRLYQSLAERILQYTKDLKVVPNDLKKSLSYLYTAVLSKICGLNRGIYDNLIIDVKGYMDVVLRNIEKFQKFSDSNLLREYNKDYKLGIDKKIDEGSALIVKYILPEIDRIMEQLNKDIDKLIDEVHELQKEAEKRKKELEKKKKELERASKLRLLFGILSGFATLLSFLGPVGAVAGAAISVGVGVAESIALGGEDGGSGAIKIPDGIPDLINAGNEYLKIGDEKKKKILEEQIQAFEKAKMDDPNNLEILEIVNALEKIESDEKDSSITKKYNKVQKYISEKAKKVGNTTGGKVVKSVLKNVEQISRVGQHGVDILNKYKDDKAKLNEIDEAIKQNNEQIENLKKYEEQINDVIKPMVNDMEAYLKKAAEGSKDKSLIALDVSKWQIHTQINDMKNSMQQFTKGFKVQDEIVQTIEKLDEAMAVMMQVYQRIQDYSEQKTFADYVYNINSIGSTSIVISNAQLKLAITNLESQIKSNIILDQYERVTASLKQFIFPFAGLYFDEFNLPEDLQIGDNSLTNLVAVAKQRIDDLRTKLILSDSTINNKFDKYINTGYFYSKPLGPFFVWKNENINETVVDLLDGKEVLLKADVSANTKNAVKFRIIDLVLSINNEKLNAELQKELLNYTISLTHLGNSYYQCDNKVYSIGSDSQTMEYSYDLTDGEPTIQNKVYEKIKKSDFILSPYTMWKIRLIDFTNIGYKVLEKYNKYVDLELSGLGQYVEKGIGCNNELDDYYKLENSVQSFSENSLISKKSTYSKQIKSKRSKILDNVHDVANSSAISICTYDDYQNNSYWINSNNQNAHLNKSIESMKTGTNETTKTFNSLDLSAYSFPNTLALTNYLIRKFTGIKEKFYGNSFNESIYTNSLVKSMEIIENFEKVITYFARKKNISLEDIEIDSTALIEPIKKQIINGNFNDIPNILYNNLMINRNLSCYEEELYNKIESIKWI